MFFFYWRCRPIYVDCSNPLGIYFLFLLTNVLIFLTVSSSFSPCALSTHHVTFLLTMGSSLSPCALPSHHGLFLLTMCSSFLPCALSSHHVFFLLTVCSSFSPYALSSHYVFFLLTVCSSFSPCALSSHNVPFLLTLIWALPSHHVLFLVCSHRYLPNVLKAQEGPLFHFVNSLRNHVIGIQKHHFGRIEMMYGICIVILIYVCLGLKGL